MLYEKLERFAIAVRDLDKAIELFTGLGIKFDPPFVVPESGAREALSPIGIELVEGQRKGSMVDRFIERRGEGIFSVMIKVSDMPEAKRIFAEKGIRQTGEILMGGLREVSFHPKDTFGCQFFLTEYKDKHPATIACAAAMGKRKEASARTRVVYEKLDRIAIAVRDLDRAIGFFTGLGFRFDPAFEVPESGAREAFSPIGIELVQGQGKGTMFVDRFIEKRGEGVFSVVIKVSDKEEAKKLFAEKGIRCTGELLTGCLTDVSFHPKDTFGCQFFLTQYEEMHPATVAGTE